MASVGVTIQGLPEARAYFAKLKDGAEALGRLRVLVGSPLKYARYQELGTRRGVRARYFLTNALRDVHPKIAGAFADALPKGGGAVLDAGLKLGYDLQARAQRAAPVRTGNLRRSIHTVVGRR